MKRNKLLVLVASLFLILLLAALPFMGACAPASPPEEGAPAPTEPEYIIRIAMGFSPAAPEVHAFNIAAELLSVRTNGQVKLEVYPASQLGSQTEVIDMVHSGSLEMIAMSEGMFSRFVPWASLFDLPFVFTDFNDAVLYHEEVLCPRLSKELEKQNVIIIPECQLCGSGMVNILCGKKPVRSLADLKGFKYRVQAAGVPAKTVESWGAKPVVLSWSEIYTSLEQGVIDGLQLSTAVMLPTKMYESIKYLTVTEHALLAMTVFANLEWWNSLPDDIRETIRVTFHDMTNWFMFEGVRMTQTASKVIEGGGVEFIYLTPTQREEFRKACEPVYGWAKKEYGEEIVNLWLEYK